MNLITRFAHQRFTSLSSIFLIYDFYFKSYSSLKMADLCPPVETRGMKKLNQDMFTKKVNVPCFKVETKSVPTLTKVLKKYLLKLPNFKAIRPISSEDKASSNNQESCFEREVFLNPKMISDFNDISADDQEQLNHLGITEANLTTCSLQLTYDNWNTDDIISAILPEGVETIASYSLVGHIIHLNLREHLLDYKHVIGEVLLGKVKQARTVVNKRDTIENTFRVFNMEVLAGDADFITEVKENGCQYKFDFSAVYWNPRLSTEHERLVKKLTPGNVLYDVFAGVGPFTIPAAKKRCEILANDLNPESFKWLQHNAKLNKVEHLIKACNKDGADFIKTDVKEHLLLHGGEKETHIVMNLPAMAVSFLHIFKLIFTADQLKNIKTLPLVHVYCFVKGVEDSKQMAQELVENELNSSISEAIDEIFFVRNVAPSKDMMRVSFRLTENIILGAKRKLDQSDDFDKSFKKVRTKPKMGKGGNQKKNKNVFKVAGARSLKAKNKAKAVTTQIKKLTEVTKQKTEAVDKLLGELQETVRQSQPVKQEKPLDQGKVKETKQDKIEKFKRDEENSTEALDKLNKMEF